MGEHRPPVAGDLHVLDPGLLTTVQDAAGRPGLARYGVPPGGAMDAAAARLANRLVGNRGDEPVLEMTLHGPVVQFSVAAHLAIAGADLGADSDGRRWRPGHSHRVAAGSVVRFGAARHGARAYLAIEGGFLVGPTLGSASTDRRSGFGGLDGRELRAGDAVPYPAARTGHVRSVVGTLATDDGPIRVVGAPEGLRWFGPDALNDLCRTGWQVAPDIDRSGIRLVGGALTAGAAGIPSLGVPVGSIQVPPSGAPIITMVDGPVTGGYPVVGIVPRADHGRLAQLRPGDAVRFVPITVAEARAIRAPDVRIEIDPGDVGAGWAR